MVLAEIADRRGGEHAVTDLLPIELPDLKEPIDQSRHNAGRTTGRSRDNEVAASVFFGRRQRECRKRSDAFVRRILVIHGPLVNGRCFAVQFDRAGQHVILRHRKP